MVAGALKLIISNVDTLKRALAKLDKETFDIIILDLNLPDSKGLDTFTKLHAKIDEVPIVVLTGIDDELIGERVINKGAQDYFTKDHLDRRLFERAIKHAISRKHLID